MTFKEAQKEMNDNWDIVNPAMIPSEPPHLILGGIIAPEGSSTNTLGFIFEKMTDKSIGNEQVLLDANLLGNNLIVYVVFKMKGAYWFQSLDSYKVKPFLVDDDSGDDGNKS